MLKRQKDYIVGRIQDIRRAEVSKLGASKVNRQKSVLLEIIDGKFNFISKNDMIKLVKDSVSNDSNYSSIRLDLVDLFKVPKEVTASDKVHKSKIEAIDSLTETYVDSIYMSNDDSQDYISKYREDLKKILAE